MTNDNEGMNFIEYAILNRKIIVTEYLKNLQTNQKIPEIRVLGFGIMIKTSTMLKNEYDHLAILTQKLNFIEKEQKGAYNEVFDIGIIGKIEAICDGLRGQPKDCYFNFNNADGGS
jgi:hypothetical protein